MHVHNHREKFKAAPLLSFFYFLYFMWLRKVPRIEIQRRGNGALQNTIFKMTHVTKRESQRRAGEELKI